MNTLIILSVFLQMTAFTSLLIHYLNNSEFFEIFPPVGFVKGKIQYLQITNDLVDTGRLDQR